MHQRFMQVKYTDMLVIIVEICIPSKLQLQKVDPIEDGVREHVAS